MTTVALPVSPRTSSRSAVQLLLVKLVSATISVPGRTRYKCLDPRAGTRHKFNPGFVLMRRSVFEYAGLPQAQRKRWVQVVSVEFADLTQAEQDFVTRERHGVLELSAERGEALLCQAIARLPQKTPISAKSAPEPALAEIRPEMITTTTNAEEAADVADALVDTDSAENVVADADVDDTVITPPKLEIKPRTDQPAPVKPIQRENRDERQRAAREDRQRQQRPRKER